MELPRFSTGRLAMLVVGIATTLAVISNISDAPIVDEIPHIGAGYSYVKRLDMRLNPEHPPLVKDLAGLPLQFVNFDEEIFATSHWTTEVNGQWMFGRTLIFHSGADPDTVKNLARAPVLVFFLLACWLVWKWTRERYGNNGAFIAVVLLAFSPTVLAHMRLVTTDMAAATGVLAATYCFLRFLRAPTRGTFALAALTLGIAFLSKFNTILLAPYFALVAFIFAVDGHWGSVKRWKRGFHTLAMTAGVGLAAVVFVVWPVYAAHVWNYPTQKQASDTRAIVSGQGNNPFKTFATWAADKPGIRGLGHWTLGLAMVQQRNAGGNTIYWLGQVVKQGGPWYFPIVYILKEPLAWWLLCAMGLATLAVHRRRHQGSPKHGSWWSRHTEEWVWLLWLAIYWGVSINSTLNIGIRHLLPVYPFAIMLVAGRLAVLMDWLHTYDKRRLKVFVGAIAILLGWYVFETVHVHPHYLTYFNQLAGGPSGGYRYVVDSNLDWGQDARRLGEFVRARGIERICIDYFGWSEVAEYVGEPYRWTSSTSWKDAADFRKRNGCDGWLAVSGTFLQNSNGERTFEPEPGTGTYRWLLDYQPIEVVGNSIFVYHLPK
jgi:hypothetical protein